MGAKTTVRFDGIDSYIRLQRIQQCIPSTCDAILIVGGPDGLQNKGSTAVLKYLFQGCSGQELLGEQVVSEALEALEDTVLLVTKSSVSIFYNAEASRHITPITSCWRNVQEYTITKDEQEDQHVWEEKKIQAFLCMIEPWKQIGLTLISTSAAKEQHQMEAEKWPLIQAYAVESVQQQGFFTMNHVVHNCSKELYGCMMNVDEFFMRRELVEGEPVLRRHFEEFLTSLDHAERPLDRITVSEKDFGDDIISFYEFGIVRYAARGLEIQPGRGARVLFGTRTNQFNQNSGKNTAEESGVCNTVANHFLVEAEDPVTGLRVCRTYFLGTGKIAARIVDEDSLVETEDPLIEKFSAVQDTSLDTRMLIELYVVLVKALKVAVDCFIERAKLDETRACVHDCETHCLKAAISVFKAQGERALDEANCNLSVERLLPDLEFIAECCDAKGEVTPLSSSKDSQQFYFKLLLKDIPSQVFKGESVGSLAIGDTYYCTRKGTLNASALFPVLKTWTQHGRESSYVEAVYDVLVSEHMLEKPLNIGREIGESLHNGTILLHSDVLPRLVGDLRAHEDGLVFRSSSCNPIIISFRQDVECFHLTASKFGNLILLVIDLKRTHGKLSNSIPVSPDSEVLYLPLVDNSRMKEHIMEVLAAWKESAFRNSIPFHKPEDDMKNYEDSRSEHHHLAFSPGVEASCQLLAKGDFPTATTAALSCSADSVFIMKTIPKFTSITSSWNNKKKQILTEPIAVSIVLGLPGSDVKQIANSICDISSASNKWYKAEIDMRVVEKALSNHPGKAASLKLNEALKRVHGDTPHAVRPRIMLVMTAYTDPVEIFNGIHDLRANGAVKISTITASVNASNIFRPRSRAVLPKLFDQLSAGWTDNIVITRCSSANKANVAMLRYRIDKCNPSAELFCLSSDAFEGSISPLLVIDGFETEYKRHFRESVFPQYNDPVVAQELYISSLPVSTVASIRYSLSTSVNRENFITYMKLLTPHAVIHYPQGSKESELKGLRLAQYLAKSKVQESIHRQQLKDGKPKVNICTSGEVWVVHAKIRFTDEPDMQYAYNAVESSAYLTEIDEEHRGKNSTFAFTGVGLKESEFHQLLLFIASPSEVKFKPRTKASITKAEKDQLQKEHMMDPVPLGYFFDGSHYVDELGNPLQYHPNMNKIIDEYLANINAKGQESSLKSDQAKHRLESNLEEF